MIRLSSTTLALLSCMLVAWLPSAALRADDEFSDCKTVRRLPKTTTEMDRLHRDNSGNQCEPLEEGLSLETTSYGMIKTAREALQKASKPAIRYGILSVGLTMDSGDRNDLPMASRNKILDYMESHFVSVQVRMRRDLVTGKQYFNHRPLAATAQFTGSKVTQPFEPLVTTAVRDFRSVGLFTKTNRDELKPEDLRTLVLMFRNTVLKVGSRSGSQFEYAFVRAREGDKEDRLTCHVFVTSRERSELVHLKPYRRPMRPNDCSIRGSVVITDFDKSGVFPKQSATRSYFLNAQRVFPMENIDKYCTDNKLEGGFFDNVDTVLDVLIDQMAAQR